MALPATDNFNRAGPELGANWGAIGGMGPCTIDSSTVVVATGVGSDGRSKWTADSFANDQYAKITLKALSTSTAKMVCVMLRQTAGGSDGDNFYALGFRGPAGATATCVIRKDIDGSGTTVLESTTKTVAINDVIKGVAAGTQLTVYVNDVSTSVTHSDSSYTAGPCGLNIFTDDGSIGDAAGDAFEAGNGTGGASATPITVYDLPIDSLAGGEIV